MAVEFYVGRPKLSLPQEILQSSQCQTANKDGGTTFLCEHAQSYMYQEILSTHVIELSRSLRNLTRQGIMIESSVQVIDALSPSSPKALLIWERDGPVCDWIDPLWKYCSQFFLVRFANVGNVSLAYLFTYSRPLDVTYQIITYGHPASVLLIYDWRIDIFLATYIRP